MYDRPIAFTGADSQSHTYPRAAGGRSYFYIKLRGAPAIGVTAAFGMALALTRLLHERNEKLTPMEAQEHLHAVGEMLVRTRPTAINLRWAIDRMLRCAEQAISEHCSLPHLAQILRDEAQAI